jgi:hypothetical protein
MPRPSSAPHLLRASGRRYLPTTLPPDTKMIMSPGDEGSCHRLPSMPTAIRIAGLPNRSTRQSVISRERCAQIMHAGIVASLGD